MRNFRIFTESGADIKFISDYVEEIFDTKLNIEDFDTLGGHGGYKPGGFLKKSIQQNYDEEKTSILILDADNDFAARQREVLEDFKGYNIPMKLFLFPNDAHNGNLESLLTEIAVERQLIDCFLGYETCVKDYMHPSLDKARIYSYLDTLLPSECKTKKNDFRAEEQRNYREKKHWHLQHEYLNPLHEFLKPFFQ